MDENASKSVDQAPRGTMQGISLLAGLPPHDLAELERKAHWQRYGSGAQILARDAISRDVFFVVNGKVRIVSYSASGREVSYAVVTAGGYFGELAAMDGMPRSANVVAEEPCLLASITPEAFRALLIAQPAVGLMVIEKLARIIRDCDERIMDLATLGAYQRVYREILRRAKPDPLKAGSWLVYPLPTQLDIASYASTTRETVARVLSSLGQSEICARKGKTLYIRDRSLLEQLISKTESGLD
jgi:CRP-like cAMP-binding protein